MIVRINGHIDGYALRFEGTLATAAYDYMVDRGYVPVGHQDVWDLKEYGVFASVTETRYNR